MTTTTKHTYTFDTLAEAQAFAEKYKKLNWFFSMPVQTNSGWEIRRYIDLKTGR